MSRPVSFHLAGAVAAFPSSRAELIQARAAFSRRAEWGGRGGRGQRDGGGRKRRGGREETKKKKEEKQGWRKVGTEFCPAA